MNAADTPKIIAETIENKPYKIGTSRDIFLINIDNGFKLLASILTTSLTVCSAKKVS